ncbi:MAG: hypothetical protein ACRD8Z_24240 [Nitrososphaeraceae archaeon]
MSETASVILLASAIVATIVMISFTAISSSNSENDEEESEEHPLSHLSQGVRGFDATAFSSPLGGFDAAQGVRLS